MTLLAKKVKFCHFYVGISSSVCGGVTLVEVSRHVGQHHQHALHLLCCLLLKVISSSLALSSEISLKSCTKIVWIQRNVMLV